MEHEVTVRYVVTVIGAVAGFISFIALIVLDNYNKKK